MSSHDKTPFRHVPIVTVLVAGVHFAVVAQENQNAPALPDAPVRTWTSVNGNVVEGAFVREEEGKIFLKRPNGAINRHHARQAVPEGLALD
jgi:hypothetical protein